jgi:pyruvate kinase
VTRTKIIATMGPASEPETVLRKMFLYGLDIVRLNFSHSNHQAHITKIKQIRALNKKLHRAIKIMQDLEGYRLRIGHLDQEIKLNKGSQVYLTSEDIVGKDKLIPFDYKGSLKAIKAGCHVFIDDGKIVLEIKGHESKKLRAKVMVPGILKSKKGINISGAQLKFPALTEKDRNDLKVTIKYKLTYIAQSFVQSGQDVLTLKKELAAKHPTCKVFAKVENRAALDNIDDIINEADGIIVARGDLGVGIPIYKVPVIQKEIIKKCRYAHKPVVVATQMLESMTQEPLPTRAEVSDVANAILDGATHLLLSGETAVGKHPHKVIRMMNNVIKHTESYERKLNSVWD